MPYTIKEIADLAGVTTRTLRYYDEFRRCQDCGQVYWRGTHYRRLVEFVDAALHENGKGD